MHDLSGNSATRGSAPRRPLAGTPSWHSGTCRSPSHAMRSRRSRRRWRAGTPCQPCTKRRAALGGLGGLPWDGGTPITYHAVPRHSEFCSFSFLSLCETSYILHHVFMYVHLNTIVYLFIYSFYLNVFDSPLRNYPLDFSLSISPLLTATCTLFLHF